jgi:hypothetical protein
MISISSIRSRKLQRVCTQDRIEARENRAKYADSMLAARILTHGSFGFAFVIRIGTERQAIRIRVDGSAVTISADHATVTKHIAVIV